MNKDKFIDAIKSAPVKIAPRVRVALNGAAPEWFPKMPVSAGRAAKAPPTWNDPHKSDDDLEVVLFKSVAPKAVQQHQQKSPQKNLKLSGDAEQQKAGLPSPSLARLQIDGERRAEEQRVLRAAATSRLSAQAAAFHPSAGWHPVPTKSMTQEQIREHNRLLSIYMNDKRNHRAALKLSLHNARPGVSYDALMAEHRNRVWAFWRRKTRQYRRQMRQVQATQAPVQEPKRRSSWKTDANRRALIVVNDPVVLNSWLLALNLGTATSTTEALQRLQSVHVNIYDLLENRFITHESATALAKYSKRNGLIFPKRVADKSPALRLFLRPMYRK
ncbi:unnamed protein product (mitochondrion) [Plasmodiophora brassicae]|uniref:Uncharacterized protein n=1 Tax=Plasmodiophora brassicae TaxID=37360 RepID=A0A0G4J8U1_PLABS|nr:hypothetical protein PBRA_003386 [Plasmodiophora brassicae]SPQ99738.1 unnamed protein product [Plasmodiophora brassicae]